VRVTGIELMNYPEIARVFGVRSANEIGNFIDPPITDMFDLGLGGNRVAGNQCGPY
jgi:hypothetical protein